MATCSHCGQETGITYGAIWAVNAKLCHTGNPDRPDCYRRVTVYHEAIGALRNRNPLPKGVEDISDPLDEITRFGEEFPTEATVCVTHKRFIPCRKRDGECFFSSADEDVSMVREHQEPEQITGSYGILLCMPKPIPKHIEIRSDFTRTCADAFGVNQHLETVIAFKSRGSSEVFHGKVDHSQPPWNTGVANIILDLHAWSRSTEAAWRAHAGLPARVRGGSSMNTLKALQALTRLSERVDDDTVTVAEKWLDSWIWRANVVLGETESVKRLPRQPGHVEPKCPWCKKKTLRQKALEGVVFCIDMKCTDPDGKRPLAILEYFDGDWDLRWQDGVLGNP